MAGGAADRVLGADSGGVESCPSGTGGHRRHELLGVPRRVADWEPGAMPSWRPGSSSCGRTPSWGTTTGLPSTCSTGSDGRVRVPDDVAVTGYDEHPFARSPIRASRPWPSRRSRWGLWQCRSCSTPWPAASCRPRRCCRSGSSSARAPAAPAERSLRATCQAGEHLTVPSLPATTDSRVSVGPGTGPAR